MNFEFNWKKRGLNQEGICHFFRSKHAIIPCS